MSKDCYYMPLKKIVQEKEKGRGGDLSERLGKNVCLCVALFSSDFASWSSYGSAFNSLKILGAIWSSNNFFASCQRTLRLPLRMYAYMLLWNDSPLANEAGKREGGCLKLIGNKEAFAWQERLWSPLRLLKSFFRIRETVAWAERILQLFSKVENSITPAEFFKFMLGK